MEGLTDRAFGLQNASASVRRPTKEIRRGLGSLVGWKVHSGAGWKVHLWRGFLETVVLMICRLSGIAVRVTCRL